MKKPALLVLSFIVILAGFCRAQIKIRPVVIGYVGGYRGLITVNVSPNKLSVINYAFVDIKDNRAWLHREATDTVNFRRLNELKKQNPNLKVVISIGGWTWSGKFSDAVLTDTARMAFAASAVDIVRRYDLDGVDIDWEYPGRPGLQGNVYRPEDKQNFTLMFRDLRHALDSVKQQTGKNYLLTTAVGGFASFLDNTEMGKAQQYLDYINLMTYDFSDTVATHHTNLYNTNLYHTQKYADNAVNAFIAAGVPASKLVMGLAFYGRVYNLDSLAKRGIGEKILTRDRGRGYTVIKDSLVNKNGFEHYRDRKAKAPYLYNASKRQFITYDDEWSVKKKCKYVLSKKMAGVMFWEYSSDPKEYLLDEVNAVLK
ncbi:MAG TPA: glycoside hydrolase family 18 protein [Mucilaginibacter sp.]|nr:glycoside hydrolase family 18 protein [Mucilaginibacter sp.]